MTSRSRCVTSQRQNDVEQTEWHYCAGLNKTKGPRNNEVSSLKLVARNALTLQGTSTVHENKCGKYRNAPCSVISKSARRTQTPSRKSPPFSSRVITVQQLQGVNSLLISEAKRFHNLERQQLSRILHFVIIVRPVL